MTEDEFNNGLAFRWIVVYEFADPLLCDSSQTILGIYKSEEKAKQHANWIKEEDPKHANHIRVYKVIYEE